MANKEGTTLNRQYSREIERLRKFIRRAESRGYSFEKNPIPEKPKRITQSTIERLKSIRPEKLYEKAVYSDPVTGQRTTGTQGRKIERSRRNIKRTTQPKTPKSLKTVEFSDVVLLNVKQQLERFQPSTGWGKYFTDLKIHDKNIAQNLLNQAINTFGRKTVALRLEAHGVEVNQMIEEMLYGSGGPEGRDKVQNDFARFREILWGQAMTPEEAMELSEELDEDDFAEEYGEW